MKVRATAPFTDLKAGAERSAGEVFEADEARLAELNSAGFGTLAEPVGQARKPARKPAARKAGAGR